MDSGVNYVEQDAFPERLLELPQIPKKLFYRGTLPRWNELSFLAVVGSRKYTPYGKSACESLIEGLRGFPISIVSGLALGIDAIAHESALKAGLNTIAVPGSGISDEVLYPRAHTSLAHRIIKSGGTILSEFEPNFKATTWSFPQRNRIMAGISHAVLVIEAEKESGTLITSRLATEYNRDVLTIPHSIFSPSGAGPHMLMTLGATPIRESADILKALHIETENASANSNAIPVECSDQEKDILQLLTSPRSRDEILNTLEGESHEILSTLASLELKGLVVEKMGVIMRA